MKPDSKTIHASRAWADAQCAALERYWQPSDLLLNTYCVWSNAVREWRNKYSFYTFRRYGCRYQTLLYRRERALSRLLEGIEPSPDDNDS